MPSSFSLSISLPSTSPLLNLSCHHFVTKQQRVLRVFSFLHSIFIGIQLSLPPHQQANIITTSKYQQPHHTLQLIYQHTESNKATYIQQLCNKVGIKCYLSPSHDQPQQQPQPPPKRIVIDLEKIPDTWEDINMQEEKIPKTPQNKKRQRSPSPPSPQTPSPPSPKSYNLRSRKVIFQDFEPPKIVPSKQPKIQQYKPQNMNSPNLKLLPPPPPSHSLGDPVYNYEYQLPNYPSHWRFRIFYDTRGFYYYLSYGNVVGLDRFNQARSVA